jgi:uncharacterized protein
VFPRPHWLARIHNAWTERSVCWLQGVRRSGKTILASTLPNARVLDCERPSVRRELRDPEAFLADAAGQTLVLDEVHRLDDPAELLKLAADHHRDVRILATGSSTLSAREKFRDTLTGRKREVWLTPMTHQDVVAFGDNRLERRLANGGLPPHFLAAEAPDADVQEWVDAYWAKDVQELFRIEKRSAFTRLFDLLLADSGSIFEATRFARACEVSRQTVMNYLNVLDATFVMHVIRPFATNSSAEIVAAPRVYGFDTAFVAAAKGWSPLRRDDYGPLWEHVVLNEIHAATQRRDVHYWRTKSGHEVDFVRPGKRHAPMAIECKLSSSAFDPAGMRAFRDRYPAGRNVLVAADVQRPYTHRYDGLEVRVIGIAHVADLLEDRGPQHTRTSSL